MIKASRIGTPEPISVPNVRAVRAWESLGFTVVGRLPGAFRHPREGFVDALVMFKRLVED